MGSTEPERSLSSGIPMPQWMKSKIGDRYDLDETFSPPSYDDSFFYIRYPRSDKNTRTNLNQKSELVEKSEQIIKQDFSQHTAQCRQFIPDSRMGTAEPSGSMIKVARSMKPAGTADNFTGDTAACGKSVIEVAHQMIASNLLVRGFSESPATGEGFNRNIRRGSKSLPSSPLSSPPHSPDTSPQTRRRIQNRYFTGAFTLERANINPSGGQDSANRYPGSWILSGLLGQQIRSDSLDSVTIQEEEYPKPDEIPKPRDVTQKSKPHEVTESTEIRRNKSMTSIMSRMFSEGSKDDDHPVEVEVGVDVVAASLSGNDSPTQKKAFRAKPSELREMNFWSPTSM